MFEPKGICPIVASPFTDDEDLDYEDLRNIIRFMASGGCHGVTLFGIAGEYYKLSDEERYKMAETVIDECRRSSIPSIISVTDHSIKTAAERARSWQEMGAECLMLLPPFFLKPGEKAIEEYIRQVASAVTIPIIVQYAPEQTGVRISPQIFASLNNKYDNIKSFKIECKPPGRYITDLKNKIDKPTVIFAGNAGYQFIESFDRGASGLMPGCSMFDIYLKIYNEYLSGNRLAAINIHSSTILPMLNHIRQNVEMIIYFEKRILQKRKIIKTACCRRPNFTTDKYYEDLFEYLYDNISRHFEWS